ncbi:MAG: hypothetical protein FJ333_06145 [Sphingomonadales bacterium]|nr:hypothetical protein [Sphingomonadales bacterium]
MFVNKSIEIRGNLSEKIRYRLCPSDEFSTGRWCIAISAVSYEAIAPITNASQFCTVSSNFCINKRFSTQGQAEKYQEPLCSFHLKIEGTLKV